MLDSPHRATLSSLAVLILGALAALAATTLGGAFTVPWWVLVLALCAVLPWGASAARSARSRLVALAALLASSLILVGGASVTDPFGLVLAVVVPLWVALAMMLTPRLRGHRMVGLALFSAPVVLVGAVVPAVLAEGGLAALPRVDLAAAGGAVAAAAAPLLLLGGGALLLGTVVDLVARLRTALSAETVRSVAYTSAGATLLFVAAAGAVAAGTMSGVASRIGILGVLLVLGAGIAVRRGLVGLASTRELSPVSLVLGGIAVAAVLLGSALSPASPLLTAFGLAVLLTLAVVVASLGGLCGAAAVLRSRQEPSVVRLTPVRMAAAVRSVRRSGFRPRQAHS